MQIRVVTEGLAELKVDALIAPVCKNESPIAPEPVSDLISPEQASALASAIARAEFTGACATTFAAPLFGAPNIAELVLVGLGAEADSTAGSVTRAFGAAAVKARASGARTVAILPPASLSGAERSAFVERAVTGALLGLYRFDKYKTMHLPTKDIDQVLLVSSNENSDADGLAVKRGQIVADAVTLARDLVNEPAETIYPETFAARARDVAESTGLEISVFGPDDLGRIGANALATVGRGSNHKPYMIHLRYRPEEPANNDRVIGLVGKCITFDSGGYNIKPTDGMLEMKGDMAGGAAVLATMSTLAALKCPVAVDATICSAENMISGEAFRPGDILTAMNGKTMEILSTDAEGRLVLADGLVYTARQGATELIDLATLTGAIVVALGNTTTGLFCSDDTLANGLLAASAEVGEDMWRMPLTEALREKIKGDVGDLKNTGGRAGGSITAALFLENFREGLPWAHFDIAGTARYEKAGPLGPKGGSGVGVLTLLEYLFAQA